MRGSSVASSSGFSSEVFRRCQFTILRNSLYSRLWSAMHLMANDRAVGGAIFGGSIIGIIIYALLLVYWWSVTIRVTAFIGVAVILGILAWIGYTMATTPPPEPIAEIPDMAKPSTEAKADSKTQGQ